jgi:hypothetical protein
MHLARRLALLPAALLLLAAGCSSTRTTQNAVVHEPIPRPGRIWVYDFVADPNRIPEDSVLVGKVATGAAPTAEQLQDGRKAGRILAVHLAEKIREMGQPGRHASASSQPRVNDLVIRGYILSVDAGSSVERVVVGFGEGASEVRVAAEGFQVTPQGLRLLGSGSVEAGGSRSPGLALSLASTAATANPAGLIVSSAMKVHDEETGKAGLEGRAKAAAEEIAAALRPRFAEQSWGR